MKNSIIRTLILLLLISISAAGQTNTFPSHGGVGIGTTSPSDILTVNGTLALYGSGLDGSTYQRTVIYSDATYGLLFEAPKNSIGSKLNLEFNWRGGGVPPLMINGSTTNVGIGTSSPQQKFHVEGNFYLNSGSLMINQTTNTNAKFYFSKLGIYTWDLGTEVSDPDNNFILYNRANSTYPISVSTANVPTFKTDKIKLEGMSSSGGINTWYIRCRDIVDNDFGIYNVSQSSYRFYINSLGNVGIGTTTPDAKLAVKGTVHAQEVKVDLNGAVAPDYVFEPDYKLTTLEEIKTYIAQHKHLPEIPSAKEMETNGLDLGAMNLLLLKKIEELTLHVIELKSENESMKRANATQDEQIRQLLKRQ